MLESGPSGSARGVSSNGHPYRDPGPKPDSTGAPRIGRKPDSTGAPRIGRFGSRSVRVFYAFVGIFYTEEASLTLTH
jgi:hypothetical protein